jgi:CRISPR type III-B/RAMP module-associated protein Cmr5
MPTKDQERAKKAFESTEAVQQWPEKEQSDYRSLVLGLPALIHDCGLCQSVAFLRSKNKKHHLQVLEDLCQVLLRQPENDRHDKLGATVRDADLPRYQHLAMEAMRYCEYLKRYAEAFMESAQSQGRSAGQ